TCEMNRDIHDADEILTTSISIAQAWLVVRDQSNNIVEETGAISWDPSDSNNSTVDYPKPIVSWDIIPHQVLGDDQNPIFKVSLLAFHRYSYPGSTYGDLDVKITVTSVSGLAGVQTKTAALLAA
ncbi:MAG: hypothetical protein ACR2GY_12070, partial [Phycisphaerales bacterium]